jgi:nucleoside-diphosphate-sugar epimerase
MRILVTGGAGRLGKKVVELISGKGHSVIAFDLPDVNWGPLLQVENVEIHKGDITNQDDLNIALRGVDGVIHLAAILPPMSERDRELTMRVNMEGTRNLLRASSHDVKFVLASSISVYGVTAEENPPVKEEHSLAAHNNYSESKIKSERLVKESGKRFMILRIAPISVIDLVELPEVIPYRHDQRVEFILDEDAATAIANSIGYVKDEIYNIAGGRTWQMRGGKYIQKFYNALGVEVEANFSQKYTPLDWYDTGKSRELDYQKTSFMDFEKKLESLGEEMGLR